MRNFMWLLWIFINRSLENGNPRQDADSTPGTYASIKACVGCSGSELSDYFECLRGLKQGCLCNPILFIYSMNEVANDITRKWNWFKQKFIDIRGNMDHQKTLYKLSL